jgi:poly(3-hydroxybutyrate) depolymerase
LLAHVYGRLEPRGSADDGELIEFDQRPFAQAAHSAGLARTGWVFVPKQCNSGSGAPCRLHVVFHGCRQGASYVNDRFVRGSGYLEWAASNGIVLLFPQIEPSYQPLNGFGCWDYWGYENEDYLTKEGPQVRAVRLMVATLRGEEF